MLIVSTNLQFLNAVEFIHKYGFEQFDLVLIKKHRSASFNLDPLKGFSYNLFYYDISHAATLRRYWSTLQFFIDSSSKLRQKGYDIVCSGNFYEVIQNHIHQMIARGSKHVFIEDGVHSILLPERIKSPYYQKHWTKKKRWTYRVKYGFRPCELDVEPTFFSAYSLGTDLELIKNDYRYMRSKVQDKPIEESSVLILGSLFTNQDQKEEYNSFLDKILKEKEATRITFCPHPKDDLEQVSRRFGEFDIEFIQYERGIEQYFLDEAKVFPEEVYAFYSSALITLPLMLEKVRFVNVRLSKHLLSDSYKKYFDKLDIAHMDFQTNQLGG